MTISTGTRFTKNDERPYRLNGERHYHRQTLLAEVTSTDEVGFEYRIVEVLAEENRPEFAGTPTGGSMAWFGWDAALGRGDVKVV